MNDIEKILKDIADHRGIITNENRQALLESGVFERTPVKVTLPNGTNPLTSLDLKYTPMWVEGSGWTMDQITVTIPDPLTNILGAAPWFLTLGYQFKALPAVDFHKKLKAINFKAY